MNYMFVNINSSTNMALAIWGCSDVQGYPARPSARVYVGHETSLILGLITCRCSGKEPAFLLGEEEDRTREFGRNEAYPCNIFSLVNQPGNNDVTFTKFSTPFFQQYYSHNTGYYGQESEAYTYTYPTGTPAQEQTQLQETNNIDLEKVMVYIECCVMLLFKFCWHFSLLLACM